MERLDDLRSYRQLIRLLDPKALRAHARRVHAARGREELALIRDGFPRRYRLDLGCAA